MASGMISGAGAGATIGSVVPGLGTGIGAAIGAGAGLLGDAVSYFTNKGSAKEQFKRNKQLMALQNQYNVENWRMQNEYNLPANQRSRLRAAGINPDLLYQNGASGVTAAAVSPTSGSSVSPQAPATFEGLANGAMIGLQFENLKEDVDRKHMENKVFASQHGLDHYSYSSYVDKKTGQEVSQSFVDDWFKSHPNKGIDDAPFELQVTGSQNIGRLEYQAKVKRLSADIASADRDKAQAIRDKVIAIMQTDNNEVMKAIAEMPKASFDSVIQGIAKLSSDISVNNETIKKLTSETTLNDAKKTLTDKQINQIENSDAVQALAKLVHSDMSFGDKCLMVFGLLLNKIASIKL